MNSIAPSCPAARPCRGPSRWRRAGLRGAALALAWAAALPGALAGTDLSLQTTLSAWSDARGAQDPRLSAPLAGRLRLAAQAEDGGPRLQAEVVGGNTAFFDAQRQAFVREAFVSLALPQGSLRLGRLLMPWGRADLINPTDSLVTRQGRWRTPDEEDRRTGNDGLALTRSLGDYTLGAAWLPGMQSSQLPYLGGLESARQETIASRDNLALRLDRSGEALDWGVSLYSGADLAPTLAVQGAGPDLALVLRNDRIRRLGADFALSTGLATVRGEAAYTDAAGGAGKASSWKSVLGVERDFQDRFNLNLQWVWQRRVGAAPDAGASPQLAALQALVHQQPVRDLHGLAYRLQHRLRNDTLTLEAGGLAYGSGQGQALRLRALWHEGDRFTLTLGGNRHFGAATGLLGALKPGNAWFLQLQHTL